MLNFLGGIRPDEHKYTRNSEIEAAPAPDYVKLCLYRQPCLVSVGSTVDIGQPLTENHKVHASISGKVTEITDGHVTIENDKQNRLYYGLSAFKKKLSDAVPEELLLFIEKTGISFEDDVFLSDKLKNGIGKAKLLVIGCGNTEPFVCSRYRVFAEKKKEIFYGAKIIMKTLDVSSAIFTIESFYKNKTEGLRELIANDKNISIEFHTAKYPAHLPEVLIPAIHRKYSLKPETVYVSCEECAAVFEAFRSGLPMVSRVVTVDGDAVEAPKNLMVPIGMPVSFMTEFCKTDIENVNEFILGGSVSGKRAEEFSFIEKSSTALLAMTENFKSEPEKACIKCGLCHKVCPQRLYPSTNTDLTACIDCGCCAYICPARLDPTKISYETGDSNND